jgi:hypothetical protein
MLVIIWCRMFCYTVCYKYLYIKTHKIIIFLVDFFGRETWSLILREARKLRVFENRGVRKLFRVMWDVVTGGVEEAV